MTVLIGMNFSQESARIVFLAVSLHEVRLDHFSCVNILTVTVRINI